MARPLARDLVDQFHFREAAHWITGNAAQKGVEARLVEALPFEILGLQYIDYQQLSLCDRQP